MQQGKIIVYIVIRLAGEIATKSPGVSKTFQKRLERNLRCALASLEQPWSLQKDWNRFLLRCQETEQEQAMNLLRQVPGVQSFSPVDLVLDEDLSLETLCTQGEELYREKIPGKTFAVRVKRRGQRHHFRSIDMERHLGGKLAQYSKVQLKDPEITVQVDALEDRAFFYTKVQKGLGGLPLGSAGRALCLISGGFDSAVASFLLQKRGVELDYVLFNISGEEDYVQSVIEILQNLHQRWSHGSNSKLHIVNFAPLVRHIKETTLGKYSQVLLKRMFYIASEKIARAKKIPALVTGEAIGQVSTQTLINLDVIENKVSIPVLRPVITWDKDEIIELTRKIGVHDLCAQIKEFCNISSGKPSAACRLEEVQDEEKKLDLSYLDACLEERQVVAIHSLPKKEAQKKPASLEVSSIAPESILIDCRSLAEYEKNHHPQAIHKEYYDIIDNFSELDTEKSYTIYCAMGTLSKILASKMQAAGYKAYYIPIKRLL